MISLNLLPKEKKAELGLTNLFITLKNVIILTLLITILVAIILLSTKAALQNHFNNVVANSTLTTQYASTFNLGVKRFNIKLGAVEAIQNNYIVWTDFFIKFSELVPTEITIDSIDVDAQKILITGFAKDRSSLLKFEGNLKQSNIFYDVETPLDNLLKRLEIDFDMKAKINIKNL